jgi:dCMP deaminase
LISKKHLKKKQYVLLIDILHKFHPKKIESNFPQLNITKSMSLTLSDDKCRKYLLLAQETANIFSKDQSTKVGAIFLANDSHHIISMGYNGMPRGFDETKKERWERPVKYKYVEHAERNAIYNACRNGSSLEDSIAIVTLFPCCDCMRAIIQSGVKAIVTPTIPDNISEEWKESFHYSKEMADECQIYIKMIDL